MRPRRLIALTLLSPLLVACGGSDPGSPQSQLPASTSPTPTPTVAASTPPVATGPVDDPEEMADLLEAAIPEITDRVTLTEDNDENDLIGRPGQYDAAVFLADRRLGCSGDYDGLSIDCGAKVERWPDAEAAQARIDDIQQKLRTYGLGAEWDYVVGRLVVRVAGDLKPSEAKAYESVATSARG